MGNTVGASATDMRGGTTLPQPFPETTFGLSPIIIKLTDPSGKVVQFPVAPDQIDADLAAVDYDAQTSQMGTIADSLGSTADTVTMTVWLPGPSAVGTEWAPDGIWRPPLDILNDLKAWLKAAPITPILTLSAAGLDLPPQVKLQRLHRVYRWPDADGLSLDLTLREWIGLQLYTTDERPPIVQNTPGIGSGGGTPSAVPGAGSTGGTSPTNPIQTPANYVPQPMPTVPFSDQVRPGDTLSSISIRNYGTDAYAWDIYTFNRTGDFTGAPSITDPTILPVGDNLALPQGGTPIPMLKPPTQVGDPAKNLPHAGV